MQETTRVALRDISRKVLAVSIPVGWKSRHPLPRVGQRKSRSKGSDGYEILTREEYVPGDSPRDIDWIASAQGNDDTLYTMHYEETHNIDVVLLVDVGRSMHFGSTRVEKRVLSAELAGSIIASAGKTDDSVRVICYSNSQVEARLPSRAAKSTFSQALVSILETEAKQEGATVSTGLARAIRELPRRRSLLFILSDFINLTDEEKRALKKASSLHDLVCVVIQDERERALPEGSGFFTLEDIATGARKTIWLNAKSRAQFKANAEQQLANLFTFFAEARCRSAVFSTEQGAEAIPMMMRMFAGHRSRG